MRGIADGVHRLVLSHAFRTLGAAHGLWPVDLATAGADYGTDATGVVLMEAAE